MYQFAIELDRDFDAVVDQTVEALGEEGFGVLVDLDIQATMKEKLDIDRTPYRILGACNPPMAHKALTAEPDIGLLLPCNVIVRQLDDGRTRVGFMDPEALMSLVNQDEVDALAGQIKGRLERVRDRLAGTSPQES